MRRCDLEKRDRESLGSDQLIPPLWTLLWSPEREMKSKPFIHSLSWLASLPAYHLTLSAASLCLVPCNPAIFSCLFVFIQYLCLGICFYFVQIKITSFFFYTLPMCFILCETFPFSLPSVYHRSINPSTLFAVASCTGLIIGLLPARLKAPWEQRQHLFFSPVVPATNQMPKHYWTAL